MKWLPRFPQALLQIKFTEFAGVSCLHRKQSKFLYKGIGFVEWFINTVFSQEGSHASPQILSLLQHKEVWTTDEFMNLVIKNSEEFSKSCRTNGYSIFQSRDFRELNMPGQAVLGVFSVQIAWKNRSNHHSKGRIYCMNWFPIEYIAWIGFQYLKNCHYAPVNPSDTVKSMLYYELWENAFPALEECLFSHSSYLKFSLLATSLPECLSSPRT